MLNVQFVNVAIKLHNLMFTRNLKTIDIGQIEHQHFGSDITKQLPLNH